MAAGDACRRRDLCKLFNKFKKEELLHGLIEHGLLEEGLLDTDGTKKAFVNRILKNCFAKEVTTDHVGLMDLLCKLMKFLLILFRFFDRDREKNGRGTKKISFKCLNYKLSCCRHFCCVLE